MISVYRPHRAEAAGYALNVAAAASQRSTCLAAGGQPPITTSGRTQPPTRPRAVSAGLRQVQDEMIELFGDHARADVRARPVPWRPGHDLPAKIDRPGVL